MPTTISGTNPRTGATLPTAIAVTSPDAVAEIVARAVHAAGSLQSCGREGRAWFLGTVARGIEGCREQLVAIAAAETGFTEAKLNGELTRAVYQFEFFAAVIREGSYLEATLDPAADTPMGPRPDLRRLLVPLGPVAVFGASNFPFAFSVLGGDTASALAAGCPVVVKAHGSHPATSALSHDILREAVAECGLPTGTVGIVHGQDAGARLVRDPSVKAVGFTGSLSGGRALLDLIGERAEPIPFYGELSSLNPVLVTPAAAAERGAEIGAGLVASITMGSGQLCTKPGIVLVPEGEAGDVLVASARAAVADAPAQILLNERIHRSFVAETRLLGERIHSTPATGGVPAECGFSVTPMLFETTLEGLQDDTVAEIFGPTTLVVRYAPNEIREQFTRVLTTLPGSLTVTLHIGSEEEQAGELASAAAEYGGRVVFDGFPTGVAVSWAQTHGGPWPSTNSLHTSVGATAIRRFLRPLTFQNAPVSVLPEELRDGYTQIPRRVDGILIPARQ